MKNKITKIPAVYRRCAESKGSELAPNWHPESSKSSKNMLYIEDVPKTEAIFLLKETHETSSTPGTLPASSAYRRTENPFFPI